MILHTYQHLKDGLFLATIMDLGSRRIMGWTIDTFMTVSLILKAFDMAVGIRGESVVAETVLG